MNESNDSKERVNQLHDNSNVFAKSGNAKPNQSIIWI